MQMVDNNRDIILILLICVPDLLSDPYAKHAQAQIMANLLFRSG